MIVKVEMEWRLALFLNCLCMASRASLMVTPLRFLAVTSRPSGKWRSIFLIGGSVSSFFRISLSSIVEGDLLTFLERGRTSACLVAWLIGS